MSFAFPKSWSDDERMNFRFQPFADRNVNSLAYDNKMKFWKELIIEISQSGLLKVADEHSVQQTFIISQDMLTQAFMRKGKSPKCLATVLEELERDGVLTESKVYNERLVEVVKRMQASWSTWSYQVLVSSPLSKLTNRFISVVSPKRPSQTLHYIVNDNVRKAARELLERVRHLADSTSIGAAYRLILTHRQLLALGKIDKQSLDLLLLWLQSEKSVMKIVDDSLGEVYKFPLSDKAKLEGLTEAEKGVLEIQNARVKLESSISKKQSQIDEHISDIKLQLAKKNKLLAQRALRKKKAVEKSIAKEAEHLHKIDNILDEIYGSVTNQLVIEAFDKGAKALKSLTDATPIDAVNETMANLSDSLAVSEEITNAISSPLPSDDADDDELEQELQDLVASDHKPVQHTESADWLPHLEGLTVTDDSIGDGHFSRTKRLAAS